MKIKWPDELGSNYLIIFCCNTNEYFSVSTLWMMIGKTRNVSMLSLCSVLISEFNSEVTFKQRCGEYCISCVLGIEQWIDFINPNNVSEYGSKFTSESRCSSKCWLCLLRGMSKSTAKTRWIGEMFVFCFLLRRIFCTVERVRSWRATLSTSYLRELSSTYILFHDILITL